MHHHYRASVLFSILLAAKLNLKQMKVKDLLQIFVSIMKEAILTDV